MSSHSPASPTASSRRRRQHSRWLVPVAIGVLGIITLVLILFALGVIAGLISF